MGEYNVKAVPLRISTGYYFILMNEDEEVVGFDREDDADKICELLNEQQETIVLLNQIIQDNEDLVSNWFIENWSKLDEEQKQSAHLELGIDGDLIG